MKSIKILVTLLSAIFIGCKSDIPNYSGTFIMNVKGKYAIDYDTLILSKEKNGSNTYIIKKFTGFQRFKDGVLSAKETVKDSWIATWDEQKQILSENDIGRQIRFDEAGHILCLKDSKYKKIR